MPPEQSGPYSDIQRARPMQQKQGVDREKRMMTCVVSAESEIPAWDPRYGSVLRVLLSKGGKPRSGDQVPFLDTHDGGTIQNVLGSVRNFRVGPGDGGKENLLADFYFWEGKQAAEEAMDGYDQGHLTDVSTRLEYGWEPSDTVLIESGKTKSIQGREFTAGDIPLLVVKKWLIPEVSATGIGRDTGAKVQSEPGVEADHLRGKETDMAKEQTAAEPAATTTQDAQAAAPANVVDLQAERERARVEGEKSGAQRVLDIQRLAAKAGCGDEMVQKAITEGWTAAQAAVKFLEAAPGATTAATQSWAPPANVQQVVQPNDEWRNPLFIAAGLMQSLGDGIADDFVKREGGFGNDSQADTAMQKARKHFRGIGSKRALELAVEIDTGRRCHNDLELLQMAKVALRRDFFGLSDKQDAVSGAAVSYIFTTSVNAVILKAFSEAPDSTAGWVSAVPCRDYQTQERIGLRHTSRLGIRAEGSAAKHSTFSDKRETYKVREFAERFVLDQQAIINDRLGVFLEIPTALGRAARRVRPDMVYAALMNNAAMSDTVALFHSTHRNLGTGSLTASTLKAGITAMSKQYIGSGKDKVNLNLHPTHVVTSVAQEPSMWELLNSQVIMKAGSTDSTYGTSNYLSRQGIQIVGDARLDNGLTDPNDGTTAISGIPNAWFLVDANQPGIEVGYVAAMGQEPIITPSMLDDGQFGISYAVQITVGVGVNAFESLYKSTGA